jgi:alkylation response protein AidB-like acyl-CoA dehydrogenase
MAQAETAVTATAPDGQPTLEELVDRARAMVPTLRERVPQTEELRRIPDATLQEFKDAGFVRMTVPKKFGGYGYSIEAVIDVTEQIGLACGSSAWMACFWPAHQFMVGWWSEEAQAEYWADGPDTISSTASAVSSWEASPVDGGVRVTGAHRFSSGIDHAEWVLLTGTAGENCLVPKADITVEDDWYVTGLKGSGSKTIRYENVFVPEHRVLRAEQFATSTHPGMSLYPDDPMYQVVNPPTLVLPHFILTPTIAMAGGILDLFDQRVRKRFDPLGMEPAFQRSANQLRFAESAAEIDVAKMLLRRNIQELRENPNMELLDRARIRRNTAYANHLCVRAVDRLMSAGDSSGVYTMNRLHQMAADFRAASSHLVLHWDETAIQYSRVRWGLPPQTFLI